MPSSRFTLTRFPPGLKLSTADRAALAGCVQRAIVARERQVRSLSSPLTADQMLRTPFLLGWVAVEAVREAELSTDAKRELVGLTLLRASPLENGGIPYGLAVLASYLAGQGALEMGSFAAMMKLAEVDRTVLDGARPDELRVLSDWLIAHPDLDDQQRLWWLWFLTVHCEDHRVGRPWLDGLLGHPALDNDVKRRLCEA